MNFFLLILGDIWLTDNTDTFFFLKSFQVHSNIRLLLDLSKSYQGFGLPLNT